MLQIENTTLIYLTPGDVLKGRVEPTIWMRMCQAFSQMPLDVELISLYAFRNENIPRSEVFDHYGIDAPGFKLTILPTPLSSESPTWWSQIWTTGFNLVYGLGKAIKKHPRQRLVIYSRSPAAAYSYWLLRNLFNTDQRPLFILETHAFLTGPPAQKMLKRAHGIVVNSKKLAKEFETHLNIPSERIQVAYLAPNALYTRLDRETACLKLGLSLDKFYIVYTGKLLFAEVNLVLEAAQILSEKLPQVEFLFVGGDPEILETCRREMCKRQLNNVTFVGFVPPARVALYQMAASVLFVYLDSNRNIIGYITPSKIFDYLQAGRPIIASDYPILHEILLHKKNSLLIEPESPVALVNAIEQVLENPQLAQKLCEQALSDSKQYTWDQRVRIIWNFIKRIDTINS